MKFTHTQADIDSAVTARLARATNASDGILSARDASITELTATIDALKAEADKGKVTNQTAAQKEEAFEKRIKQMEDDAVESKRLLADEKAQKVLNGITSKDKDAILKAGFDPKFSDMALNELHKLRTLEDGAAFYKDADGAIIDQSVVIDSIKAQYPEFITINRSAGNNIPTGVTSTPIDFSKESTADHINRRNAERKAEAAI